MTLYPGSDPRFLEGEIWRQCLSLPEYLASNYGRIMREEYRAQMPAGGERKYGGEPWFGVWEKRQRRYTFVFRGRTYRVAVMVCEAFHGPRPFEEAVCMHLDENPRNNRPDNLRWGTMKENMNAPGYIEYCRSRVGDNSCHAKAKRRNANV